MSKHYSGRDLWDRMCGAVAMPDGGPVFECHPWTLDKLHFLCRYLAVTTTAMVGSRHFDSVNYIDLFAGSGICRLKNPANERRYPGSPILAAGCEKPFNSLFLVDKDAANITALQSRLHRIGSACAVHTWHSDANAIIGELISKIPSTRALNVLFVDPYSLDIHFSSIEQLARNRSMDLLMLFADAYDIVRNVETYYYPNRDSKLDKFLGVTSNWRQRWDLLGNREGGKVRELFANIYLEQLATLGYEHTGMRIMESDRGPMYRLIYASKSALGLKFWNIAIAEDWGGERTLWTPC